MIHFPTTTKVGRILPKEAFYKRLPLTQALKEKFVSDVKRITLEYSLSATSLHLDAGEDVTEILILVIDLKKQEFDPNIVEVIAKHNPHKLVFLLRYEEQGQLALYHNKRYATPWAPIESLTLEAKGFHMDAVWESVLEQIALTAPATDDTLTVTEQLEQQEHRAKLEKEIAKLEKKARTEKQPRRKLELVENIERLKKEIAAL